MEKKLAQVISVVFQPLLIPTFSLLILFSLKTYATLSIPSSAKNLILSLIFILTFVFPVIFLFLFYKRGIIKSVSMESREERILPLFVTAIFYFLAYQLIHQLQIHYIFQLIFLGSAMLVTIGLLVSLVWKISAHMIGIGGLLGGLVGVSQVIPVDLSFFILTVSFLCGLVGFARLKLEAHTSSQVYAGFLTGFAGMLVLFLI
ncbi:MAG: hypothetical protein K9G76_01850 [Bacteroidales bacterium]|nr:hypothetical protein [Bacteroidales bacterium]MCF8403297.1 hypothetical protein [Bacteroidales bacterium]